MNENSTRVLALGRLSNSEFHLNRQMEAQIQDVSEKAELADYCVHTQSFHGVST